MRGQERGLDVGDKLHAALPEEVGQALRRGDLVGVPMKDAALLADLRVTAGEIEASRADALLLTALRESAQAPIRVGRVGVFHRAAAIAPGPVGHRRRAAAESGEAPDDLRRRAEDEIEHHALLLKADRGKGLEIIVELPPEVRAAVGIRVVKDPVAPRAVFADIKGKLLVERVAVLCGKAHRVRRRQREAAPGFVHRAALVPETEDALALLAARAVDKALAQLAVEVVSETAPVCVQDAPVVSRRDAEVFLLDREIDAVERKAQRALVLLRGGRARRKAFGRKPVSALERDLASAGADAPCGKQRRAVADEGHAQDMIEKVQAHRHAVRGVDAPRGSLLAQLESMVEFHAFGSPFVRRLRVIFM